MQTAIEKSSYAQYDLHLELINPLLDIDDDEHVVEGFAIRKEDATSFLFDLKQLISRYGVFYSELVEKDDSDDSLKQALSVSKSRESEPNEVIDL